MNKPVIKISPQFTPETFGPKPTVDQKILVFEDRELGWRLRIAEKVEPIQDAGYAVISILFAYFEMFAQYATGVSSKMSPSAAFQSPSAAFQSPSAAFQSPSAAFRKGVRFVYPARNFTDYQLDTIYDRVRCGMFHNGYTKFGTLISRDFPEAIDIVNDTVRVNPHKLRPDLLTHFTQYIATLKDDTKKDERAKFEKIFDAGTN
jgi:hypothetical protein